MNSHQKGSILLPVIIILIVVGVLIWKPGISLYKKLAANPAPKTDTYKPWQPPTTTPIPTISPNVSDWKLYSNKKYSFQVRVPSPFEEESKEDFASVRFLRTCVAISTFDSTLDKDYLGKLKFLTKNADELDNLTPGKTKTYQLGEIDSSPYLWSFTKISPRKIGAKDWQAFRLVNSWETHGNNELYYLRKNGVTYVIETIWEGPCEGEEDHTEKILSTFKFSE